LDSIEKNKDLRHRKSLQCVNLLKSFFINPSVSLEFLSEQLKAASSSKGSDSATKEAEILKGWVSFWLRQLGAKNEESKNNAVLFQQELHGRLVAAEKADADCKLGTQEKIIQFNVVLLKLVKERPGNSLRGKKMVLQNYMLNKMYSNGDAFNEYFKFLQTKVRNSETISCMNYYLNEIEALAQSGILPSGKGKKNNLRGSSKSKQLKKEQDKLRVKILKYLLNLYGASTNWKTLLATEEIANARGNPEIKKEIKSNDEINIKNFQKGLYERIINTIFKSIKFLASSKSASQAQDSNEKKVNGNGHKASHDSKASGKKFLFLQKSKP
jgi:hypothetical protein